MLQICCGVNTTTDEIDVSTRKIIQFICDQLRSCCVNRDNGRRYNAEVMQTAVKLMLHSRNCYRALLNILAYLVSKQLSCILEKLEAWTVLVHVRKLFRALLLSYCWRNLYQTFAAFLKGQSNGICCWCWLSMRCENCSCNNDQSYYGNTCFCC